MTGMTSPVTPSPVLRSRIEQVYQVFRKYPLRRHIEGCHCGCIPANAAAELHATALRDLTAEHLSLFSTKTMTTWGDEADFKHFLPRLLELIAYDQLTGTETLLGKLTYGQWWSWPEREYVAVSAFLHTWWGDVLAREISDDPWEPCEVGAVLQGLSQAEHDLTPYLISWGENSTPQATHHLAAYVLSEAEGLVKGELLGAYWTDHSAQAKQVMQWLLDGRQQARLEAAAQAQVEDSGRERLEMAGYTLSVVRN